MPTTTVNGVRLFYELAGQGVPLVLVHGSWDSHHDWDLVAPVSPARFVSLLMTGAVTARASDRRAKAACGKTSPTWPR